MRKDCLEWPSTDPGPEQTPVERQRRHDRTRHTELFADFLPGRGREKIPRCAGPISLFDFSRRKMLAVACRGRQEYMFGH
jgi:hypothetical protein